MDLQLAGKTAVVTAASGGIAGAVVRTLLAEGARVLEADRTVTPELKATGAATVEADLTGVEGVERVRQAAESEFGAVDLLVNGVGGLAGSPGHSSPSCGRRSSTSRPVWRAGRPRGRTGTARPRPR